MSESNLLRFNKDKVFVVFDIESEDLRLLGNRGWQLSYLVATQNRILEEHDYFLWWDDLNMSADAARITRFNYEEYKQKAQDPKKILEQFDTYLYNPENIIVGANIVNFDIYVLNTMRKAVGLKTDWSFVDRMLDIQCIEKAKALNRKEIPQEPNKRAATMFELSNWRKKGVKTSVEHLAKNVYQIDYDPNKAHDAKYDNRLCLEILKKQIYTINI